MKSSRYIAGTICIALAFIACVISYYFVIFALPVFIVGALLVVFSKTKVVRKILTIMLPVLLWIPCSYVFLSIYGYTGPKVILVPEGCEGELRIVFGEPCGQRRSNRMARRSGNSLLMVS
jgi:hypothetical protein